jgi:hypothetical protein
MCLYACQAAATTATVSCQAERCPSFDFNNVSQYGPTGQQFIYPNQTNLNGGRADGFFCNDGVLSNFMTPQKVFSGKDLIQPDCFYNWSYFQMACVEIAFL